VVQSQVLGRELAVAAEEEGGEAIEPAFSQRPIIATVRRTGRLPEGIEHRLATLGATFAAQPAVRFAYVFGGAARGELRPLSDVDVAVYLDEGVDPVQTRLELMSLATKHLGTDAVDLVILNRAPTALLGRILRTRRVIAENDPLLRHRFESLALRQFLDFRLFEQRFLDRRFARG
jgi:predicted nucleotidyltransferase